MVRPRVREYDHAEHLPRDILDRMAELGFFGGTVLTEWGGAGLDHVTAAMVIGEISKADHILGVHMNMPSGLVGGSIRSHGTDAQKWGVAQAPRLGAHLRWGRSHRAAVGIGRLRDGHDLRT